ncbi:hypothetical protein [Brachyspira murdochii]|uniref:ABC transporter permease n=1 Tax=Brachyspira murdochii TaxID=84378 RepID=A0ABX5B213_9SPIR|nr:hypothetical protein [Brachyspira murdochii]PPS21150.1 hypothetical protein DJ52_12595 [Brachyspira murdochii]
MHRYFIIFLILAFNIVYAQENTNKTSEYTFIYEKEKYFNISDTNSSNEVSIMIERRGLPLVNRLVRFISLKPDVFDFEIPANNEEILLKDLEDDNSNTSIINTSDIYIIPTDENGTAKAKLNLKDQGSGVVLMHILYVGSTGNTNISYEEYAYVNVVEDKTGSISSKLINGDIENLNAKSSIIMTVTLFPSLFLVSIALILISYFRHIYDEYRNAKSKIVMYTFFGFSSIKKNFRLMIFIILAELIIVGCFMFLDSYIFSVILIAFFIAGFLVKREKMYAIAFFILSCISMIYLYLETFTRHMSIEYILNNNIMQNPVFIFFLFFFITALSGGIYIPICLLVLYKIAFITNDLSLAIALISIFVSSILYIVKVKKNIPFLYSINLLKIKD